MIEIDFDIDASDLLQLGDKIEKGVEAGVQAVTEKVADNAREGAQKIADRPIPLGANGKPLWERSGDLEDSIVTSFPSAESGNVAVEGEAEEYGQSRHQLGEPTNDFGPGWTPKNPAGGIIRHDPFLKEASEDTSELPAVFEAAFNTHIQ